jgi:hypothetical protein
VQIIGTAVRPDFDYYKFEYRPEGAAEWSFLTRGDTSVSGGPLMTWETSTVAPGTYWLRLIVVDKTGNYWEEIPELRVRVVR